VYDRCVPRVCCLDSCTTGGVRVFGRRESARSELQLPSTSERAVYRAPAPRGCGLSQGSPVVGALRHRLRPARAAPSAGDGVIRGGTGGKELALQTRLPLEIGRSGSAARAKHTRGAHVVHGAAGRPPPSAGKATMARFGGRVPVHLACRSLPVRPQSVAARSAGPAAAGSVGWRARALARSPFSPPPICPSDTIQIYTSPTFWRVVL
jgi:hypothetical protein